VYAEFYCAVTEDDAAAAGGAARRSSDAGEIFDLNVGGDRALARSNFFCFEE
jgi:hypothetical protein